MICFRRKFLQRIFRLAAYPSARHFAMRGYRDSSGGGWRPLVLRWALRHRRALNILSKPAVSRSLAPVFQHFHFHLTSNSSGPARIELRNKNIPAASAEPVFVHTDHHWMTAATAKAPAQTGGSRRPAQKSFVRDSSPSRERSPEISITKILQLPPARRPVTSQALRLRRSLSERMPETGNAQKSAKAAEAPAQISQTRAGMWQHHYQIFSHRRKTPDDPRAASPKSAAQFQPARSEELVWRSAPRRRPGAEDESYDAAESGNGTGRSQRGAQRGSQPAPEPSQGAAPDLKSSAPAQLAKLDPAVLDRLADNVIERVEKRIRIERQRRGL